MGSEMCIRDRARSGRGADGDDVAALELGAVAQARLCAGHGALPVLSAGDAADHRRHHARRGDSEDPPASEARRGPTSHCPSTCPPGRLCLGLGLRCPSHGREVRGPGPSCVVLSSFPCPIRQRMPHVAAVAVRLLCRGLTGEADPSLTSAAARGGPAAPPPRPPRCKRFVSVSSAPHRVCISPPKPPLRGTSYTPARLCPQDLSAAPLALLYQCLQQCSSRSSVALIAFESAQLLHQFAAALIALNQPSPSSRPRAAPARAAPGSRSADGRQGGRGAEAPRAGGTA